MPKDVSKFSGFSSLISTALAVGVGVVIGAVVGLAVITMLWGFPDLWPLGVG